MSTAGSGARSGGIFGKFWFCAFLFVFLYFANFWIFSIFDKFIILVVFFSDDDDSFYYYKK